MIKKIICLAIASLLLFSLMGCENKEEKEMKEILKQFDLTEPKELWTGTIDDEFEIDRVVIIMKKTSTYPQLELKHFQLNNGKSLEYSCLKPNDRMLSDVTYLEGFRQIAVIYLKRTGKEKVLEAMEHLNELEFVKYAGPKMIYTVVDG